MKTFAFERWRSSAWPSLVTAGCASDRVTGPEIEQPSVAGEELDSQAAGGVDKVTICHIPPGNPENQHTIIVGAPAVPAHLAHGDHVGACDDDRAQPATRPPVSGPPRAGSVASGVPGPSGRRRAAPTASRDARGRTIRAGAVDHAEGVHAGHRGRVPDRRSPHPRAEEPHRGDAGRGRAHGRQHQARAAPQRDRGGLAGVRRHPRGARRRHRPAPLPHPARGQGRRPHRGRGHASHQPLEGPGDHRPRALRRHRQRDGGPRPRQPDLRPARPRRDRGPRAPDPDHERRARVPAPPAGPVRELPLLVRPPQRA